MLLQMLHKMDQAQILDKNITVWHKTMSVENFGILLPKSILVDKTLGDWLLCTVNKLARIKIVGG